MLFDFPTTATISAVFAEGVQQQSGHVTQTFDDGARLFSRSLLPFVKDVRPNDQLQGGLALRATENEIWLHPYVLREVCQNGAIIAHTLTSLHVEYSEYAAEEEVISSLQEAICACSEEHVFTASVGNIRTSIDQGADVALNLASMLRGMPRLPAGFMVEIFRRLESEGDRSRFSLMNAVTSVARDTRDPEQRWRLEELGGAIGAGIRPRQPQDSDGARRSLSDKLELC